MRRFLRTRFFPVILVCSAVIAGACDEKDIFLQRMETHSKALKSLRADITAEFFNSQLAERDVYKGKIVYLPGRNDNFALRLDWTTPSKESLAVVNKKYLVYRPLLKVAYTGDIGNSRISVKITDALEFFNISKERLKAHYEIKYVGEEKIKETVTYHLEFKPKTKTYFKTAEI
jgi:outer membrane lipoprotein-sorting protein